ncbi:MAG: aldehyde ferredoxin oxidoreductase family protein [Chloroflexota bacterium]
MPDGYTGRIARVDLTTGKISDDVIDDALARKYLGGVGIAARILWEETGRDTAPLSPENRLVFMTGPLAGSSAPKSSRYIVAAISPLTGIWGNAHSGGSFADELRHAGFDGIVVEGQSERPVYLWLHDNQVEIRDAAHLWGKDTYETSDLLKKETDAKASPACIGVAGEKLVNLAAIMNDGKEGRAAARCGLGAVMGAKKLKAVVARGTLPLRFHDEARLKKGARRIVELFPPKEMDGSYEGGPLMYRFFDYGRIPVKNWSAGTFEAGKVYVDDLAKMKATYCRRCAYGCGESHETPEGERHVVYQAWGPMGTSCLIANPEALQQAFGICQRYGMDAISTGAVVAFAMECFENGLITENDTGGIALNWGNHEAMIETVRRIAEREGFGEVLGHGVRRAAEIIGGNAADYAMHVKGLEFPAPDPRSGAGLALGYATGSIGATHMETHAAIHLENLFEDKITRASPELGYPEVMDRFDEKGKGRLVARSQDFACLLDSMTLCLFLSLHQWAQPSHYVEMLNAATGWDIDLEEFLRTGERIFNLKRMFNVRRGISRRDDTLPARILTQRLPDGGTRGYVPDLEAMLTDYYTARDWSEEGVPNPRKLKELDLEDCIGV